MCSQLKITTTLHYAFWRNQMSGLLARFTADNGSAFLYPSKGMPSPGNVFYGKSGVTFHAVTPVMLQGDDTNHSLTFVIPSLGLQGLASCHLQRDGDTLVYGGRNYSRPYDFCPAQCVVEHMFSENLLCRIADDYLLISTDYVTGDLCIYYRGRKVTYRNYCVTWSPVLYDFDFRLPSPDQRRDHVVRIRDQEVTFYDSSLGLDQPLPSAVLRVTDYAYTYSKDGSTVEITEVI